MNYQEFAAISGMDGQRYDCRFFTLMTAISLRHSDTVDVRFLVNGRPVVVALPNIAFADYRNHAGATLSDADIIDVAGLFLKELLEKEGWGEAGTLSPSAAQTLQLAEAVRPLPAR